MYFRLFFSSLRKSHIFFERRFRINRWQLKDAQTIKQSKNEISKDEPIKYSTSDAGKWKAIYSTSGERYFNTPRIQPLVVVLSLTSFMVYFCILREENDLDDWLRELETIIPIQLEEAQLRAEIEHGKKHGKNVCWQQSRLEELTKRREEGKL